jgi:hypothetical protein
MENIHELRDLLIRVDERTLSIEKRLNESMSSNTERIIHIENKIDEKCVTKEEFQPVRLIVYGLVGIILVAVVGALIGLVIMGKPA